MRSMRKPIGIGMAVVAALPFTALVRGQERPDGQPAKENAAAAPAAPDAAPGDDGSPRGRAEAQAREAEARKEQALQQRDRERDREQAALQRKEAERRAMMERDVAAQRAAQAADALRQRRRHLGEKLGRADVSAQQLRQTVLNLEAQREALELDDAGAHARRQALEKAINAAAARAEDSAASDPAVAELKALVKVREAQVARMAELRKAGAVPEAEIDNAQAQLAEARASLAQREREAATARGGDSLAIWNRELVELTVAQAERSARLAYINERLKLLKDSMDEVDELDQAEQNLRHERAAAEAARDWAEQQQRQLIYWDDAAMQIRRHEAEQPR